MPEATSKQTTVAQLPSERQIPALVKGLLGAMAALAEAVIALITTLGFVHWTTTETTLVTAEAGVVFGFVTALTAHLWPNTKKEPVGVAAAFTAVATATIGLGSGFQWWTLTTEQIAAVVSVVSSIVGVGTALTARHLVTAQTSKAAA